MGRSKRELEDIENRLAAAKIIAIDAGALKECESHGCLYQGDSEPQSAYMLGNHRLTKRELGDVFSDSRQMTDAIKAVIDDSAAGECPACHKIREQD